MGVLLLTAWTTKAASPTPPRCSASDTRRNATHFEAPYSRFCGPARGVVYLNGETYTIRGGHCYPRQAPRKKRRRLTDITIGLFGDPPATPGRGIWLPHLLMTHPGLAHIDDSEIEVPGMRVGGSGTVIVRNGLKDGSFFLYGRDASGPTGVIVTGTWTCG
jgi:hypothetical protein